MTFNRATLDKYLMAAFIGLGMIVGGLSSPDRWWIAIGAVVLGLTLLLAAIDIYGWINRSKQDREGPERPPSKLRVLLMLPVCLAIAAGLIMLGGTEGIIMAVLLVLTYALLLILTFAPIPDLKLGTVTHSIPLGGEVRTHDGTLFKALTADPQNDEETLKRYVLEHPELQKGAVWDAVNALTGGRLKDAVAGADNDISFRRTPDGVVMERDVRLETSPSQSEVIKTVLSTLAGKPVSSFASAPGEGRVPETARSLLTAGDDLRNQGLEADACAAYEKAEAHAVVDWASAQVSDRGLLPTILVRLGKLDVARKLVAEELVKAPNDPKLLTAQELLDEDATPK
ncbi:MAG TPA: hypothetical protein VGR43_07500 [Dehalococcoidia bacterium]|nr:hypothetical protein [Dehalococcoidia bacterium]